MRLKNVASSLIILLCLTGTSCKNTKPAEKPKLEQSIKQEEKTSTTPVIEYFKSFRTISNNKTEEPSFSKEIEETYGREYYYELKDGLGCFYADYHRPNPDVLFKLRKIKDNIEYEFSYGPGYEQLKIHGEGYTHFLITSEGMANILDIKDGKINRISLFTDKDKTIYYGAIDNEYYDWENIDPSIQIKFEKMAKNYMEEVYKPAKEELHLEEILQIYRRIKG